MKNWNLYKRNTKTNQLSLAFPQWSWMTEKEARNCEGAYIGTYQPNFHFFASKNLYI